MLDSFRISGLCLFFVISVASKAQVSPGATPACCGFGMPDRNGTRLLLMADVAKPELLKAVLCPGALRYPVRFDRRQVEREGALGRQVPDNFDNLAGSVFTILAGRISPSATCLLASESFLKGTALLNTTAPRGSGACLQRHRFAMLRDRQVVHCWPIAHVAADKEVALLEFRPVGTSALASVVVVDGARTMFADYPAEFRAAGQDLWRVDDGGVLSPDGFEIVCALQRGDWYALGVAWSGAEGHSLSLWIAEGSQTFRQVVTDYWYRAPA